MPKVESLGHIGLYVRETERSVAFYRDILGLKVSDVSPTSGNVFMTAQDRCQEHHELLLISGREEGKVLQQISFRCSRLSDVRAFYDLFVEKNIPIVRVVSHGNAVGVYFLDPDGNQVEVYWPPVSIGRSLSVNRSISRLAMKKSSHI